MSPVTILFFFVFALFAGSYSWGMRGTIIGGEKGAMLPGAFLGLLLALFSGSETLASQPYLLAGVGALSMYCGGNMTYADTLSLSMAEKPAPNMKKGLIALAVKGGVWFGLFGGYVSLFISILSGFYAAWQLIVFFVFLPISALLFYRVFNLPFQPEKNRFPKIYFSYNRRETWGGLLGMLLEIFLFAALTKDFSTLAMTFGLTLTGALGWIIAQLFQISALHPNKRGKKLFDSANRGGLIDAWKIMECCFGALGGIGMVLTFLISRPLFAEKFESIDKGLFRILPESFEMPILIVFGLLLLADTMQYFILPGTNRRYYKKLRSMKLLTQEDYEKAIQSDKPVESERYIRYKKFCDKSEFAVYSIIPLTLCFFGCYEITVTAFFMMILLVLCQEFAEKSFGTERGTLLWKLIVFLPEVLLFIVQIVFSISFSVKFAVFLYTFFYEAAFFIFKIFGSFGKNDTKFSNSEKTVHGYFVLCCLLLNILTLSL